MPQPLVAIFCTTHADSVGNSCRLQLLAELSKRFDVTVVTNQVAYIKSLGIGREVIQLPNYQSFLMRLPVISKLFYAKKLAGFLNKVCNGKKLFVFHDTSDYVLYLRKDIPVYTCVHQIHEFIGLGIRNGLSAFITKMNGKLLMAGVKRSKVVFANFQTIADFLKKHGVNQDVVVTPHFIDKSCYGDDAPESSISDTLHMEKSSGSFIMTYTGWVSENRGLQLMLDVVNKLSKKGKKYILCIVGCQDDYKERIIKFAQENTISDRILVYGRVNYDLMPAILKASDVCLSFLEINPVYTVSPPQKVVEYFAAGKPVVANHIVTHEALIKDGITGYLLDNADSIAEKIELLQNDKQLYDNLSQNVLAESEKYDKEFIVETYYKNIVR